MKLNKILPEFQSGDADCQICNSVGLYFDEQVSNSNTGSLSICSCVLNHCKACPAKGKPPFRVFDPSQNIMLPCFCHEAREKYFNLSKVLESSNIPQKYKYKFFGSIDTSGEGGITLMTALDWAEDLVKYWNHETHWKKNLKQGMYLTGNVGSGKTLLACIILNELIFRYNIKCMYAKINKDFLNALKDTYQKDSESHGRERNIEMEFAEVDVLVIDDFGVQKESEWANSKLYDLIDGRYEREKITLLTSNLPLIDWKEKGEGRVYSRLCEMAHEIKIDCPDYREKFKN
jgi:DNA replication protein DnaC